MKKYINKLMLLIGSGLLLTAISCKKDMSNAVYYNGFTDSLKVAESLNTPGDTLVLSKVNQSVTALNLAWNNPNFNLTDGPSSQNVSYAIQVDTVGDNFKNPATVTVVLANLAYQVLETDLNKALTKVLNLGNDTTYNIQIRLAASIGGSQATQCYSNVITYPITTYLDVAVPIPVTGQLFLIGSCTVGGWNQPVPVPTQQFTQVSATEYTITAQLTASGAFDFIPVNGSWSTKYCSASAAADQNAAGGPFEFVSSGGNDFLGPAIQATYTIDVNFLTGKYTLTAQ